jgi:solute carrier family 39 (zinc transporter), member 1/2/3
MLHDADHALSSPCLPAAPWHNFPFPGFVATRDITRATVVEGERKALLLQANCHPHSHAHDHSNHHAHAHELHGSEGEVSARTWGP